MLAFLLALTIPVTAVALLDYVGGVSFYPKTIAPNEARLKATIATDSENLNTLTVISFASGAVSMSRSYDFITARSVDWVTTGV